VSDIVVIGVSEGLSLCTVGPCRRRQHAAPKSVKMTSLPRRLES